MRRVLSLFGLCCAGAAALFVGLGAAAPDRAKGGKAAASEDLFSGTNVVRIQIEISRSGLALLRNAGWGNGQERPTAKVTVREGGVIYTNVALHLKGAAGSFRALDDNPCFTLNFEKFAAGQAFHGLHKISLNNSVQDRSYLSEKICRELFEAAGVPVARAGHAKVEVNGRDLGLRVLTEGFNKQFLKRYFANTAGNLYDGGFVQDVTSSLAVNSGDHPEDHSGQRALVAATRESDPTKRMARLEQVLDMDCFLSYVAMDVIQCDWDGYAMNRNNWRIFHDLEAGKMVFFPHGLDQMFGVERTSPECPILPPMQGLVARQVIGTPEGRRRYLERMSQLYTNVFHVEALLKRVDDLAAVIRPVIAESNLQAARSHDQQVQRLKQRIARRDASLRQQLGTVSAPLRFSTGGTVQLSGWKSRIQGGTPGTPTFSELQGPDGRALLYVSAPDGDASGSWRTRALVEHGSYRFEGKLRTKDLKPRSGDAGGGAGLRVSRGTATPELSGTVEWRTFSYPFQVQEDAVEVEFICELRAAKGEAWFDRGSLRVIAVR